MSYKFELNGKEYELPDFNNLPMGVIRKSRKFTNELDSAFSIIESVADGNADLLDALDKLPVSEFNKVLEGWTTGAAVGESSGSSN
jgi:hypothetical protein